MNKFTSAGKKPEYRATIESPSSSTQSARNEAVQERAGTDDSSVYRGLQ